jgi:transposase
MDSSSTAAMAVTPVAAKRKKRQVRSIAEKQLIVEEALVPGASVALIARAHGVNANQLFAWRKAHLAGRLIDKRSKVVPTTASRLLPVTVSDAGQRLETVAADAVRTVAPVLSSDPSGSIHIQFPKAQVRVVGSADVSALRVVLECLLG